MGTLLEEYARIHSALIKLNNELSRAQQSLNDAHQIYTNSVSEASIALEESLSQNTAHTARVNAFIGIAKTHTTKLIPASAPIPFDNGKLSRLAVQVNSGITDDPFATQLYTEATGQLQYLSTERGHIQRGHENKLRLLESTFGEKKRSAQTIITKAESGIRAFLYSKDFTDFIALIETDQKTFNTKQTVDNLNRDFFGTISIGSICLPFPIPRNLSSDACRNTNGLYDAQSCTIKVPANLNISNGAVIIAEYDNHCEGTILSGIQNFILNIARYYSKDYSQICFIDPIRFNSSSLGNLAELCGGVGSLIDLVPNSIEELRNKVKSIITEINIREVRSKSLGMERKQNALYVFHNFPQSYDATVIAQIQQLCVNAQHYGITVILTNNKSSKNFTSSDTLAFLRTMAITVTANSISGMDQNITAQFDWYRAPNTLPSDIERQFINERPVVNLSNDYGERIGIPMLPRYRKGVRTLEDIPFGIDSDGTLKTLDFENSNFATFICGAARSGKTTLLHTLITGFIQNNHPDDIEIWLIDFKMIEFSRYINHLPPHVRYIILDESPELVYDIIDRLTEIMLKRQNIFKGKWQKLKDVPEDKYMPAILVIIDEFSVMSQIVADSIVASKENYAVKLQVLLAKGAALGLHFIFASQGFTSGTRGLNDFSKKQVQQRIAMKTEYSEIKDTLDLKSPSEEDKALMEQLPVHHAVTRIPADERGNHLCLSQVLYISDYSEQEKMIDAISEKMTPAQRYDVHNLSSYINKRPMIIDGNIYGAFNSKSEEIQKYLDSHYDILADGSEFVIFVGEPRRMMPIFPIHIANEFCENLLIVAPLSEKMPATSVLLSIGESLRMQSQTVELWSTKKNPIYRHIKFDCRKHYAERNDLATICSQIKHLKNAIQNKVESNQFFVLIGFESILIDMSFQTGAGASASSISASGQPLYEKRSTGEPDLNTLLASLSGSQPTTQPVIDNESRVYARNTEASDCYDAREDLKYILTNGPRLGYHFVMHFSSPGDVGQSKIDISLFKHKIMFRAAKNEAALVIGAANSAVVANLEDHSFRYSNGLDSLSFRPYLYAGLSWDGWQISGEEVVNLVDEEEEYLL